MSINLTEFEFKFSTVINKMVESRKRKMIEITDYELANKFRSKKDFYSYLSDNCKYLDTTHTFNLVQYYLPPIENLTKDFLRSIFTEEK